MKRLSEKRARKMALGSERMHLLAPVATRARTDASRAILNLEQNDQMIALLQRIAEDQAATRAAMEAMARK